MSCIRLEFVSRSFARAMSEVSVGGMASRRYGYTDLCDDLWIVDLHLADTRESPVTANVNRPPIERQGTRGDRRDEVRPDRERNDHDHDRTGTET